MSVAVAVEGGAERRGSVVVVQAVKWTLPTLPDEMVHEIALLLDYESLARLSRTCLSMYRALASVRLWRTLFNRVWPIQCAHLHPWRSYFRRRMRQIRKGRPFVCPACDCNRGLATAKELVEHVAKHPRDPDSGLPQLRKYRCAHRRCSKPLRTRDERRNHEAQHSGDPKRPYRCTFDGCDKNFARPSLRSHHEAAVHKMKPMKFACTVDLCQAMFPSRGRLHAHLTGVHKLSIVKTQVKKRKNSIAGDENKGDDDDDDAVEQASKRPRRNKRKQ
eukprot:TRINITY_DN106209_c0_g1_i1.p1 TRINITY_DN106209_c0_g1~~TRINITY_DN106209_c0_g1_i1.p1  ORF type:complete len:275 (-),score=104.45 TRINITY_DN106209_c0_g1_i1:34-858(-)